MDARTTELAQRLKALHQSRPLVVPTVWDVWSARTVADAGFDALTVGSHPVADSLGMQDNEGMSFEDALGAVRRITSAVDIPVSADMESGYAMSPADLVAGLLEAGAVGLNLEDTVHGEDGRMRSAQEHASYVAAVREAAERARVPVVINGRTDFFKTAGGGDLGPLLDEGIARLRALAEAGADSLYPVAVTDDESISALVQGLPLPVNITARPESDDLERLTRLGVGRISFGPRLQGALTASMHQLLTAWRG